MTRFSRAYNELLAKAQEEVRRLAVEKGPGVANMEIVGELVSPGEHSLPEKDILERVLAALRAHPKIAWCERTNSGAVFRNGRMVTFGFPGQSDITGQLRDGRRLDVECKRRGKDGTEAQLAHLNRVDRAGGVAFVAWGAQDVYRALDSGPRSA